MKNVFTQPDWVPCIPVGTRILISGATGGLGRALVRMLLKGSTCMIGAHGSSQAPELEDDRITPLFQTCTKTGKQCKTARYHTTTLKWSKW